MSDRTAAIKLEYDALKSDYDKLEKENQHLDRKNKSYVKIIKNKQDKNKEQEKEIKELKEELRATKQIVWEQEKIEKMGVETYIKRQSLQGNIPEYKLITHDEPSEHHQASSNELHIYEATGYQGASPIQMTWDYTNEILNEFFSDHYTINDIYNHYCLDMRWVEFIKEKWGWKFGTKLRFSTKTNSDGYMNFWKRDDDMRCDFMIDENGVFCSHLDYKYYSDNHYVAINCTYNQKLKDTKEDLRKKDDIEELKKENKEQKEKIDTMNEQMNKIVDLDSLVGTEAECDIQNIFNDEEDEEDEEYMYDVKNDDTTYYLGDSLDEARKHAQERGLEIWKYTVEDGNLLFDDIVD